MKLLHTLEALLSRLLSLARVVGVVDGSLETPSDIVRVLIALSLGGRLEVTRLEVTRLEHLRLFSGRLDIDDGTPRHTSLLYCLDSSEVLGLLCWPCDHRRLEQKSY